MSDEDIKSVSLDDAVFRQHESMTDWQRPRREQENGAGSDIDSDEGEFDWSKSEVIVPPGETMISLRLDDDLLACIRRRGRGYRIRINAVLRSFMTARQAQEVSADLGQTFPVGSRTAKLESRAGCSRCTWPVVARQDSDEAVENVFDIAAARIH